MLLLYLEQNRLFSICSNHFSFLLKPMTKMDVFVINIFCNIQVGCLTRLNCMLITFFQIYLYYIHAHIILMHKQWEKVES